MQIAVYAIAKNEAKHVERWYQSVMDADSIHVLDTGSEDNTIQLLKNRGVSVTTAYLEPFRFDVARNMALNQVPEEYDYAMFLDMDEELEENWREKLEETLSNSNATSVHFRMIFAEDENDEELLTYNREMVHVPKMYQWLYPAHEILIPKPAYEQQCIETFSDIKVYHRPDNDKPRDYRRLLELGVNLYPNDPRTHEYLAAEYLSLGSLNEAHNEYVKHIELETHPYFRSESYRNLAKCCEQMGDTQEARDYFVASCAEAPDIRESWGYAAEFFFRMDMTLSCLGFLENMVTVPDDVKPSMTRREDFYRGWPNHMAALCYWKLGDIRRAKSAVLEAAEYGSNPNLLNDILTIFEAEIETSENSKAESDETETG